MAGSQRTCCVPKCGRRCSDNTLLHSFPHPEKDKARFLAWTNAVGQSMSSLSQEYIYKNRRICGDHFEEKYKTWKGRLTNIAMPTLLMSETVIDLAPSQGVLNQSSKDTSQRTLVFADPVEKAFMYDYDDQCQDKDHVTMHGFPNPEKEPQKFQTWLYAIGGNLWALDHKEIHKKAKVCHKHFEKKYGTWTTRSLSINAVPTLHMRETEIDVEPSTSSLGVVDQYVKDDDSQRSLVVKDAVEKTFVNDDQCEEVLDEPIEIRGPFSWQQPSAVVPCDADVLESSTQTDSLWDDATPTEAQYFCNVCQQPIEGYRYVCVQCADFDLCAACEAAGRHQVHYVLRVPHGKAKDEVYTVLQSIRRALSNCIIHLNDEMEIKEETDESQVEDPIGGGEAGSEASLTPEPGQVSDGSLTSEDQLDTELLEWGSDCERDDRHKPDTAPSDKLAPSEHKIKLPAGKEGTERTSPKAQTVDSKVTLQLEKVKPGEFLVSTQKITPTPTLHGKKILQNTSGAKVTLPTRVYTSGAKVTFPTRVYTSGAKMTLPTRSYVSGAKVTLPTRDYTSGAKVTLPTRDYTSGAIVTLSTRDYTSGAKMTLPTRSYISGAKVTLLTRGNTSETKIVTFPATGEKIMKIPTVGLNTDPKVVTLHSKLISDTNIVTIPSKCANVSGDRPKRKQTLSTKADVSSAEPAMKKPKDAVPQSPLLTDTTLQRLFEKEGTVCIQRLSDEEIKSALRK